MQQQLVSQLPLSQRIPALASAIRAVRAHRAQIDKEEAEYLELLKHAEQELKVHPPGSEDTEPSGLLSDSGEPLEGEPPAPEPGAPDVTQGNEAAQAAAQAAAPTIPKAAQKKATK